MGETRVMGSELAASGSGRIGPGTQDTALPSSLAAGCRSHRLSVWRCVPRPESSRTRFWAVLESTTPGAQSCVATWPQQFLLV